MSRAIYGSLTAIFTSKVWLSCRSLSLTFLVTWNPGIINSQGIHVTEIPRRINSTNIFTSKGDDFDNLVILASFPPVFILVGDPLSQIGASEMIFWGRFT